MGRIFACQGAKETCRQCTDNLDEFCIPWGEIVEKLSAILNFQGIVPSGKSEMLEALLHFRESNIDIVDCLLAAHAADSKPIMSFDYAQSHATCRFNNR